MIRRAISQVREWLSGRRWRKKLAEPQVGAVVDAEWDKWDYQPKKHRDGEVRRPS